MQALDTHVAAPEFLFPIKELEQLESMITTSMQFLGELELRRSMLMTNLERITRPASQPFIASPPITAAMGVMYRGEWIAHTKFIDIHKCLLRKLWIDFPDRRYAMALAMGRLGTSRVYVVPSIGELFPSRQARWGRKFSCRLVDEWYVDTNVNPERIKKLLAEAVNTAGLMLGKDVIINWG